MNIILSGASSGVGFEAVIELIANKHHKIIALARSEEKLNKLQEIAFALNPDCYLSILKFDIAHDSYENILIPFVKEKLGTVDVLINNAGSLANKSFMQTTQLDFAEMLQNNFLGHIQMIQHLAPLMPQKSHILNIGSMSGFQGSVKFPGLAAYSASKAALHTLTECLAIEFADRQIAVNCLALGSAQTEMLEKAFPEYQSPVLAFEMGKYIADFALNGHKFFNGKIIPVAHTTP